MDAAARRRATATGRLVGLREDDGAMDRAAWAGSTMSERIAAVLDLFVQARAFAGETGDLPRLQRSVLVVSKVADRDHRDSSPPSAG